jgi:diguanylate cyclase (GGDEF)-like protein
VAAPVLPAGLARDQALRAVELALRQAAGAASLYFIDLDRYSRFNEALGQAAGDQVLVRIATRLQQASPDGASLLRWGGDEFVLLVPQGALAPGQTPAGLGQQLLEAISRPLQVDGLGLVSTASLGHAHTGQVGPTCAALLAAAEAAMRRAKLRGGARCEQGGTGAPDAAPHWTREALVLESRLHDAVGTGTLALHYQPQVQIGSGRTVGMEALLRWRQPDGSLWAPGRFLPVAEQCGAIIEIGAWVLHEACAQMMRWQAQGLAAVPVSVNVSARQCLDQHLPGTVRSALAGSGLPAALLNLEITESAALADLDNASRLLGELRGLGVGISMDDFGTGYSSLALLSRLPISQLKIDQSFVQRLDDGSPAAHGAAIVRATIELAHGLGMPVVAEGVESADQLRLLGSERCDYAQGYYCSRPLAAHAAQRWLRATVLS